MFDSWNILSLYSLHPKSKWLEIDKNLLNRLRVENASDYHFLFHWIDGYTLIKTNINSNKTEIEMIQSQTKNKTSLPYYVR